MRQKYWTRISRVLLVFAVIGAISCIPSIASACTLVVDQQSCSNNYGVGQAVFNSGGVNQCPLTSGPPTSAYCANISVGDLTDGGTASGNSYQSRTGSGFVTNREPYIQLSIGGAPVNLGYLSATSATTTTANFSVETYLASGYTIQSIGNPPTDNSPGNHILTPLSSSPTTSSPGTDQFGINLANVAPQCAVSGYCTTGTIASHYNTANSYYYPGSGMGYTDTLVTNTASTGIAQYTITYLFNISGGTPDGTYTFNQGIVATSTY